ncbi:hypothetical protein D1007_57064 [Hordeum vulgare]|nr:hypothetical protein D1007_57064 [Hordeum vulgare]
MVKPAYAVPHPLVGDQGPADRLRRAALDIFVPTVLRLPRAGAVPTRLSGRALKAVAPYPHLAAASPSTCSAGASSTSTTRGVLLIEATVPVDLAGRCSSTVAISARVDDLYPAIPEENIGAALAADPAQQVQVRWSRGRPMLPPSRRRRPLHEHVLTAWRRRARERLHHAGPIPRPCENVRASKHADAGVSTTGHGEFTCGDGDTYAVVPMDRIKNLSLHFSAEFIADLKARVGAAAAGGRADPPLPMDFFGNMGSGHSQRLQVRDSGLNSSYSSVVGVIRDAVKRIDDEYGNPWWTSAEWRTRTGRSP